MVCYTNISHNYFMEQLLQSIYRFLRSLPIIGSLVKSLRDLYHHPALENRRLRKRDIARAHTELTNFFGTDSPAHQYLEEFIGSATFKQSYSFGYSGDFDVFMLHTLTRMQVPEVIVETGVASGRSSAAILDALEKNGKGKLYSIDLPLFFDASGPERFTTHEGNSELTGFVPQGKEPGWLIPDHLRPRWELILGDSNVELPKLLARLPVVDIFYHDGDHSYETMSYEFKTLWEKIPVDGFLFSDDTKWNDAWKEFVARHPECPNFVYRSLGIIRKQ